MSPNLFLGFPVSRAKIADIVLGSAPPTVHATQHEDGGSDEIDTTGLVGAGGISFPTDDIIFNTLFESIDGYKLAAVGSGAVSQNNTGTLIDTGVTSSSRAGLAKSHAIYYPSATWDKNRSLSVQLNIYSENSSDGIFWINSGTFGNYEHIGFKIDAGKLYATVHDGTSGTEVLITDYGTGGFDINIHLKVHLTAGTNCKFYKDGVLESTITTNLPSGTTRALHLFNIDAQNESLSTQNYYYLTHLNFWQSA